MSDERYSYRVGSFERVAAEVETDHLLDAQTVELSLDEGATWLPAAWEGSPASTRRLRTVEPAAIVGPRRFVDLLVRVTEADGEKPVINAGSISIEA